MSRTKQAIRMGFFGLTGLLILLCSPCTSAKLHAQVFLQDSLKEVISQATIPKTRILTLDRLASSWYGEDFEEMALVSRQLIRESRIHTFVKGQISGYNKLGTALMSMSRYDEAEEAFEKGYHLADSIQYLWGLVQIVPNLGVVCYYQDDLEGAEKYYRKALALNQEPKYAPILSRYYYNMAILFHDQRRIDSARLYYGLAESVSLENQDTLGLIDVYNSLGVLHEQGHNPIQAQRYFELALDFALELRLKEPMFVPYFNLARMAIRQEDIGTAQALLDSARTLAISLDSYDFMQDAFRVQSQLDSLKGSPEKALYWARRYDQVKDSLYARDRQAKLAEMQTKFQTRETEREYAVLKMQNAQTEAELNYQRRLSWAIAGIALSLAGLALMYFWYNKKGRMMLARLREAYREKDALLGIVAHDLKAPLANIQGLTDILTEGNLVGTEHQKVMGMIKSELDRGDLLVRDLLELDAIENGTLYMNPEALDLVGFLHAHTEKYQYTASKKSIDITEDIPLLQCTCKTDRKMLARVLDNLISNAIKFSPFGRQVRLGLREEQAEAVIFISDEGPGFSEADMELVFQKFRRLSAKPTGGESSTGLGLAIVKGLIESLGGKIHLESRPGAGARFEIRLPVAA